MSDPLTVLSSLRADSTPELIPLFNELEDFYSRKLWHQLTNALFSVMQSPHSTGLRLPLFNQFISGLDKFLNTLAFVSFAVAASDEFATPEESVDFLNRIAVKVEKEPKELLFVQLRLASVYIQLQKPSEGLKLLESCRHKVDDLQITDKVVLAQFYLVSCEFYKSKFDYTSYYRNALLYLACVPLDSVPKEVQSQRAFDLCVAALLADKIYNFGELVQHSVLSSLDADSQWIKHLINAVNAGNIPEFQRLKPEFSNKSQLLAQATQFLEQKICLMALCECVFKQQHANCELSFNQIAKETHLQAGAKVEILVMKAFSLDLLRGTIDEVSKTVRIHWLHPRTLDQTQIGLMKARLNEWDDNVKLLAGKVKDQGAGVWQAV